MALRGMLRIELLRELAENEDYVENNNGDLRRQRVIRDVSSAWELSDYKFKKLFRLPRVLVLELCRTLEDRLTGKLITAVPVDSKILIALRFYAVGCYQVPIGQDLNLRYSQSTVSRCINSVSRAINEHPQLMNHLIRFPVTDDEQKAVKSGFMEAFGFPGVIGCVDGTHVAIIAPPVTDEVFREVRYVNRKGFHSINVQIICDSKLRILSINARFPGSTHDSHVFKMDPVKMFLEQDYIATRKSAWLLGDSGYALSPWLMTPFTNPAPESAEMRFNALHSKTRCVVERVNGVLKQRFRSLLGHRVLHYHPTQAGFIINACATLHNLCVINNVELDPDSSDASDTSSSDDDENDDIVPAARDDNWNVPGRHIRLRLLRTFENRRRI